MKTTITGLLKGRITRWGTLAGILLAAGLSVAWLGPNHYRFGGAWISSGGGIVASVFDMPFDSAGRTAAMRITPFTHPAELAGLLTMFGADTVTESAAQADLISQDTAKWASVGYYTKQGNPPAICTIYVLNGTLKFTGPDRRVVHYRADYYAGPANSLGLPNADADGDGFPDPGATPVLSVPDLVQIVKRVTVP